MDTRTLEVERSTSTAHRLKHYDGACTNVHGHNMEWEVEVEVSMEGVGEDNMPLDFKDVSDLIDETDHAVLLNEDDPLVPGSLVPGGEAERYFVDALGDCILFEGDPTCEMVSKWMARRLVEEVEAAIHAEVTLWETSKYSITSEFPTEDEMREVEPTADLDEFTGGENDGD